MTLTPLPARPRRWSMMPPNERTDPKVGPSATARQSTTVEKYVRVPIRLRREHREWSNAEQAAWFDLLLAAYEHRGRFESIELIRALLGQRAGAADALIGRGELTEDGDEWVFTYYAELYDLDGKPRDQKTQEERLADAEAKLARGEPLTPAEHAARSRARANGAPIPDARRSASNNDLTSVATTTTTTTNDKDHHDNEAGREVGRLVVDFYGELYGRPPSAGKEKYLVSLAHTYGERRVVHALSEEHRHDPDPKTVCGRMEQGLKRGNNRSAYAYMDEPTEPVAVGAAS